MVEVIVLTNENATGAELDTYQKIVWYPCDPIVMVGKNSELEPSSESTDGQWRGRDIVGAAYNHGFMRYGALECFTDDHLFFLVSQDHRFWREDCDIFELLEEYRFEEVLKGQGVRQSFNGLETLQPPHEHLRDALAYRTAAKRWKTANCPHGHGEWIWMSSEAYYANKHKHYHWDKDITGGQPEKRKTCPGRGNYLHCVTAKMCRFICKNILVSSLASPLFLFTIVFKPISQK